MGKPEYILNGNGKWQWKYGYGWKREKYYFALNIDFQKIH